MAIPTNEQLKPWHHVQRGTLITDPILSSPGDDTRIYAADEQGADQLDAALMSTAMGALNKLNFTGTPECFEETARFITKWITLSPTTGEYTYWSPWPPTNPGVLEKLPERDHNAVALVRALVELYPMLRWTLKPI